MPPEPRPVSLVPGAPATTVYVFPGTTVIALTQANAPPPPPPSA